MAWDIGALLFHIPSYPYYSVDRLPPDRVDWHMIIRADSRIRIITHARS